MARVTVEDCLEHVDNRFELVMLATKRARALAMGSVDASVEWENDKPTVVALREIAEGHITRDYLNKDDKNTVEAEDESDGGESGETGTVVTDVTNVRL